MGLDIYFQDDQGEDIELDSHLQITHNLNKIVDECGKIVGKEHYALIWS